MAKKTQNRREGRPAGAESEFAGGEFAAFAREDAEDHRNFRLALGGAVVFHLILLLITFPELYSEPLPEKPEQQIYVVQQIRFRPPPVNPTPPIPEPRAMKVPIPDPTPDDPEPIRIDEPEPEINLQDLDDIVFGIPNAPPPPEPVGPIHLGGDVVPPVRISAPPPRYTEMARRARIQGNVFLQAVITKEGQVTDVELVKGLPFGLDEEAIKAVRVWKFQPATLNGKPVAVYYRLKVIFALN